MSEENEEGMTNFQKIEIMVGKDVTDQIINQVSIGNISKAKAEEFAFALHNKVGGKFKNSQSEVNFVYDDLSMIKILSYWYEIRAHSLNKSEILGELKRALTNCGLEWLVSELSAIN